MTEQALSQAMEHIAAVLMLRLPSADDQSAEASLLLALQLKVAQAFISIRTLGRCAYAARRLSIPSARSRCGWAQRIF
jgi:hypothetical protein